VCFPERCKKMSHDILIRISVPIRDIQQEMICMFYMHKCMFYLHKLFMGFFTTLSRMF